MAQHKAKVRQEVVAAPQSIPSCWLILATKGDISLQSAHRDDEDWEDGGGYNKIFWVGDLTAYHAHFVHEFVSAAVKSFLIHSVLDFANGWRQALQDFVVSQKVVQSLAFDQHQFGCSHSNERMLKLIVPNWLLLYFPAPSLDTNHEGRQNWETEQNKRGSYKFERNRTWKTSHRSTEK